MSRFEDLANAIIHTDEVCNHDRSEAGNYPCKFHRGHYAIKPMNELLELIHSTQDDISYWAENDRGSASEEIYAVCENIRGQIKPISKRDDIAKHKVIYHNQTEEPLIKDPTWPTVWELEDLDSQIRYHTGRSKEAIDKLILGPDAPSESVGQIIRTLRKAIGELSIANSLVDNLKKESFNLDEGLDSDPEPR